MSDPEKRARELASDLYDALDIETVGNDVAFCATMRPILADALRAERKRALEEAERACRDVASENETADVCNEGAFDCADRIAGLEQGQ